MWLISIDHIISIDVIGYQLKSNLGVFALIAFIALWFFSIMVRGVQTLLNTPKAIAVYKEKTSHQKGLQALAYGLSAVAANDVRMAQYYTKRSTKYLKHDFGLNALLSGLAARLAGDTKQSEKSFQSLLDRKETSVLGLKGLLNTAMDNADYRYARVLIDQTIKKTQNQPWILNAKYDLELKTNHYAPALIILEKLKKQDVVSKSTYIKDKSILMMLCNNTAKAHKINPITLPITLEYLKILAEDNKRRKSLNIIKNQWVVTPHPKLLDFWIQYAPKKTQNNPLKIASWIENLYHVNSDPATSALYCGETLIKLGQTEQDQRFVKEAMTKNPTIRTYQLMHRIDPQGQWLDNIQNAKTDMTWVCKHSGRIHNQWQPITSCGHFNTIKWDYPDQIKKKTAADNDNGLINFLQSVA